jgi:hypothetical protein
MFDRETDYYAKGQVTPLKVLKYWVYKTFKNAFDLMARKSILICLGA